MKQSILLFLLAASTVFCPATYADPININLRWSAPDGFLIEDDFTGLLELESTAVVQLVYSPTFYADYLDVPAAGVGGSVTGDGEEILDQFVISDPGGDPYGFFIRDTITLSSNGWWYARVYAGGSNPAENITEGMWYYQSALFATINNVTPETPTLQNIQGNNPSITYDGFGDIVNRQVIPEPSVLAMLGLGGLALMLRRRLKI